MSINLAMANIIHDTRIPNTDVKKQDIIVKN